MTLSKTNAGAMGDLARSLLPMGKRGGVGGRIYLVFRVSVAIAWRDRGRTADKKKNAPAALDYVVLSVCTSFRIGISLVNRMESRRNAGNPRQRRSSFQAAADAITGFAGMLMT